MKKKTSRIIIIAFSIFVLITYIVIIWSMIQSFSYKYFEDNWILTRGTILSASYELAGGISGFQASVGYKPRVSYEYYINGKVYRSHKISNNKDVVSINNFLPAHEVDVYYDPRNFNNAVLVRSEISKSLFVFLGLLLTMPVLFCFRVMRQSLR